LRAPTPMSEGVRLRLAIEGGKYLFQNILKYKSSIKNSVGFCCLLTFCARSNFRGTCSCVNMLKGYMVRERLRTPVLT